MSDRDGDQDPSEDLARIVIRAGQLGFSQSRVATALRISSDGLASIQQRIDASARAHELDGHAASSTTRRTHHF